MTINPPPTSGDDRHTRTRLRGPLATAWAAWTAAGLVIAIALVATVNLGRPDNRIVALTTSPGGGGVPVDPGASPLPGGLLPSIGPSAVAVGGGAAVPGAARTAAVGNPAKYQCAAGRNGGATDTGVSADKIKLAATVVKSGTGSAFLGDVEYGMESVLDKVNRNGGICGRQLSINLVDDGWNPTTGQGYIRNFINEGYFALAVEPSSEGVRYSIDGGDIDRAQMPVVGTDGMLIDQYQDPWVWPVSTSTNSFMHIMAKYAFDKGARNFGIVWDQNYKFGKEGHNAFLGALNRLGGQVKGDLAITAGQSSYKNDVNTFNSQCADCDFVALLLEPETATTVVHDGVYLGTSGKAIGAAGPQTLFTYNFASNFAQNCDPQTSCKTHFLVWTGFKPPVPPDDTDGAVQTYVNTLAAKNGSADRYNQFVEGGYVGMELLVQAIQQVGPNLTRANLRQVLDSMDFNPGVTGGIESFRPGHHFADTSAQAYSLTLNGQTFAGFRYEQTGFLHDLWVGLDTQ